MYICNVYIKYIYIYIYEQWWLIIQLKTVLRSDTTRFHVFLFPSEKFEKHEHLKIIASNKPEYCLYLTFESLLFIHTKTIYKYSFFVSYICIYVNFGMNVLMSIYSTPLFKIHPTAINFVVFFQLEHSWRV